MRLSWFYPVALTIALSAGVPATAVPRTGGEPAGEALLASLQAWLDQTVQLEARFEQELVSGALGGGLVESGRLWIERPGRMRWDYSEPERKVAIVEGSESRLYIEADRQMWIGRLEAAEALLPALLAGDRPLGDLFLAAPAEPSAEAGRSSGHRLRLVPRQEEGAVAEVVLTLDRESSGIREAEVQDTVGNRMHYRFTDLRRNRDLPEGWLAFEPPKGTEILARP